MDHRLRIVLVEDEPKLAELLGATLERESDFELAGIASGVADGFELLRSAMPDVLLTDLGLPDGSGVALIRHAAMHLKRCDVMVITVFGDEAHVVEALEAGAAGYLHKDTITNDLPQQIRAMRAGGSPISPMIARRLLLRFGLGAAAGDAVAGTRAPRAGLDALPQLSPRERETLQAVAKGFTYDEIAQLLGVASTTVNTYVRRIYEKLQVRSKTEAVYEARQMGLLGD